jgi:hypothetical protein
MFWKNDKGLKRLEIIFQSGRFYPAKSPTGWSPHMQLSTSGTGAKDRDGLLFGGGDGQLSAAADEK